MNTYTFSIIICTYNRCDDLKVTLKTLADQKCDWSSVAEIIIVDNNSTDNTKTAVQAYIPFFEVPIKYFLETRQGKSHALNSGITRAQGDVLVFTDDDVELDPLWLKEMMSFYETHDVDILGGRVDPIYPQDTPAWVRNNRFELRGPIISFDLGEGVLDYADGQVTEFPGVNVAYKKKLFDELGPYSTELGPGCGTIFEDIEMFRRVVAANKKIFYNGRAVVRHKAHRHRMTIKYISDWSFVLGKSTVIMEQMNNKRKFPSIFGVPRWLYRTMIINLAQLALSVFNQKKLIRNWNYFHFNLGMASEYARISGLEARNKS